MNADAARHIPQERIIQMIADGGARRDEQEHLGRCGPCREMMAALESDLDQLRRQALQAAPAPQRRFVLPADRPQRRRSHRWRLGWAAAGTVLTAALLTIFVWGGRDNRLPERPPITPPLTAGGDPEMIAVNMLAESALPQAYKVFSESLIDGYDEGFIDFLIPSLDDDSVS